MKLEIHPFDGFSTGVFLDQRNNRAFLAELSRGQEVLNCFSYTCAFSVACARQGGFSTSIDLSKKYLEWGKRNFELNGLKSEEHPFYCVDVFEQFKRAKKMGKQYGLIILDPPSFSRTSQGKVFSLRSDLKRLIEEARDLLLPEGVIFFSCNLSSLTSEMLSQIVVKNLTAKGNRLERIELPSVPEDFTSLENPLSAVCFRLKS
jgi:23S rRNA (cytosine1962-C5)-methyltransferase